MPWRNGHYYVSHPREPWGDLDTPLIVHAGFETLKGREGSKERLQYEAAKYRYDVDAAFECVDRCVTRKAHDNIIAHVVTRGMKARIIRPHPAFDDEDGCDGSGITTQPTNAIPFAYARFIAEITGRPLDEEIIQVARVGRTKLKKWPRFLCQPHFGGAVRVDEPYIIVDDVVTTAGTIAALRSYILRNGGSVVFASGLAEGKGGFRPLAVQPESLKLLHDNFGPNFERFWLEGVGHGPECLTEAEARFLGEWSNAHRDRGVPPGLDLLQRLRARLDKAAAQGR